MGFSYKELNQNLPSGWKFVKISDIADVNLETVTKNYQKDIIRYIDISSVSTGLFESPRPISFKDAPSRARRIVREGDIIISTVRPNLRQYSLLEGVEDNWIASTGFAVVRAKDAKYKWYLYSFLTSNVFNDYLVRVADGAAYPTFNPKEIEEAEIPFPDDDSLEVISNLARVINQKIELNNRINQNLESLAQLIFRSWFVDFIPVHAKKNALEAGLTEAQAERASMAVIAGLCSPSEYAENTIEIEKKLEGRLASIGKEKAEKLKNTSLIFPSNFEDNGTPIGWKLGTVRDVANVVGGYAFKSSDFTNQGYPVIKIKNISNKLGVDLEDVDYISPSIAAKVPKFHL